MPAPHWVALLASAIILVGGCAQAPSRPAPERKGSEAAVPAPAERAAPERPAAEPSSRSLTIELGSQRFVYAEDDRVVRIGPISSGRAGYETPSGRFSVRSKQKDKVSYRYTNALGMRAWMPYSIQFHGDYFLHEGWLPGYPDSHGCVRVGEQDARFLFDRLRVGDPVTVVE